MHFVELEDYSCSSFSLSRDTEEKRPKPTLKKSRRSGRRQEYRKKGQCAWWEKKCLFFSLVRVSCVGSAGAFAILWIIAHNFIGLIPILSRRTWNEHQSLFDDQRLSLTHLVVSYHRPQVLSSFYHRLWIYSSHFLYSDLTVCYLRMIRSVPIVELWTNRSESPCLWFSGDVDERGSLPSKRSCWATANEGRARRLCRCCKRQWLREERHLPLASIYESYRHGLTYRLHSFLWYRIDLK